MIIFNNTDKSDLFNQNDVFLLSKRQNDIDSIGKSLIDAGLRCEKYNLTSPQTSQLKSMLLIDQNLVSKIEIEIFEKDIKPFHYIFSFASEDDSPSSEYEVNTTKDQLKGERDFFTSEGHIELPLGQSDINAMIETCGQKSYYEKKIGEMEQKQKGLETISSLGQFTGSIIHDLNNYNTICMTALDGIRILNNKQFKDDKLEFFTSRGLKGCKMLNSISAKYRKFMFVADNAAKDYYLLNNLVFEAMSLCENALNKHRITWKVEIAKGIKILCTEASIIQILINLISNSIYEIKEQDAPWISVKAKLKKHGIILYVIDSGSGIAKDIQEKIFDPLFSTKTKTEGTGFGLSFCKDELSKMDIKLSYVESKNTVFALEIPTSLLRLDN